MVWQLAPPTRCASSCYVHKSVFYFFLYFNWQQKRKENKGETESATKHQQLSLKIAC